MAYDMTTRVGAFAVTTLWDGDYPCGPAFMPPAASPEGEAIFRAAGLPAHGPLSEPINAFAIERDGAFWLVDGGVGKEVMPGFGRVPAALHRLGREPDEVETIVLTHLHEDHIGGLLTAGGKTYANARLVVPAAELRFWTDPQARRSGRAPDADFERVGRLLDLYPDRVEAVEGTRPFAPGLSFRPLPGHTPGHSGLAIEDAGDALLMWTDTVHSASLQLAHPDWQIIHDIDPEQARSTRRALLEELAGSGLRVLGSHVNGAGRVERAGQGYILVPHEAPLPAGLALCA